MYCRPHCVSTSKGIRFQEVCPKCGRTGWSPGDGRIVPWPRLVTNGIRYADNYPGDLKQLELKPLRTRLNLVAKCWASVRSNKPQEQLDQANKEADRYGLRFVILREGVKMPPLPKLKPVEKDEPLLLCLKNQSLLNRGEFPKCPDARVKSNSGKDPLYDSMKSDMDSLAGVLAHRDVSQRGALSSRGLKNDQKKAVELVLENTGTLTIAALPTGYGKTRIAQTAAWCLRRQNNGPAVMISPLISLMDDQRAQFDTFSEDIGSGGIGVGHSGGFSSAFLTVAENRGKLQLMDQFLSDKLDIFCCSPETMMSHAEGLMWIDLLTRSDNPPSLLIIDEAHVIGDWGASIRPEFQLLGWVKDRLMLANPDLRILLMSATISTAEETELKDIFSSGVSKIQQTLKSTKTRDDLYFHLEFYDTNDPSEIDRLVEKIHTSRLEVPPRWNKDALPQSVFAPPTIIYTPYKKDANNSIKVAAQKKGRFGRVKTYTGDTSPHSREDIREQFINNQFDCLVATSAFGMGIDKPDVWSTAYIGMPWTLKGLYQSFGRTARRSDWPSKDPGDWRSGACICAMPRDGGLRRFKSELGPLKTLERLYDMLYHPSSHITDNGYGMLPLYEDLETVAWDPCGMVSIKAPDLPDSDEDEDSSDDYNLLSQINDWEDQVERQKYRKRKRKSTLKNQRLWVISCLQRTQDVDFLGIHRRVLFKGQGDRTELLQVLEDEGYEGVMQRLRNVPRGTTIDDKSTRFAVVRFDKRITGWSDAAALAMDGYKILRERHDKGREQLKKFISLVKPKAMNGSEECIRLHFSEVIGLDQRDWKTCLQLDRAMPCSNCKGTFNFDLSTILWSTKENTKQMGWHTNVSPEIDWPTVGTGDKLLLKRLTGDDEKILFKEVIEADPNAVRFDDLADGILLEKPKTSGVYRVFELSDRSKLVGTITIQAVRGKTRISLSNNVQYSDWSSLILSPAEEEGLLW